MPLLVVLLVLASAHAAGAQPSAGPAIVQRSAPDNVTVRAVRLDSVLRVDGRLDEDVYRRDRAGGRIQLFDDARPLFTRAAAADPGARIVTARVTVTPSARMLISSLVQFNVDQHTVNSSVRLRWEYSGGSELFVVYSDGRDTQAPGWPALLNRTLAIKATRLFGF